MTQRKSIAQQLRQQGTQATNREPGCNLTPTGCVWFHGGKAHHEKATNATFRVTREVFDKFCEAADVEGYIGRIDFCAGLTAIGIKNEYVDDSDPDDSGPRDGRTFERE